MAKLTNVTCDYTGGGVWVYSARFNDEVWLYGGLDWYFGSYSIRGSEIEDEHDNDYDLFWKNPSVPFPTWNEILESLRTAPDSDLFFDEWEHLLRHANPEVNDMNSPCIILEDDSPLKDDPVIEPMDENTDRLTTISEFIEAFEDFLEEKGIDIPNDEKDNDPDASTIYGTDYGNLSDRIEKLLVRYGVLKGE